MKEASKWIKEEMLDEAFDSIKWHVGMRGSLYNPMDGETYHGKVDSVDFADRHVCLETEKMGVLCGLACNFRLEKEES